MNNTNVRRHHILQEWTRVCPKEHSIDLMSNEKRWLGEGLGSKRNREKEIQGVDVKIECKSDEKFLGEEQSTVSGSLQTNFAPSIESISSIRSLSCCKLSG